MDARLISRLTEQGLDIVPDMDLSTLSSLGTGGKAECLATPHHIGQLVALLDTAREHGIPVTVIGSLTNTLVSDEGIEGIVISTKGIRGIVIKGDLLTAYAGERLDEVINKAIGHNLSGLEELGGIPGTVGGATFGNAGANGTEISTHFFYSDYITKDGRIRRMPAYSDAFSYRHSPFTDDDIILSTAFRLIPNRDSAESRKRKEHFKQLRIERGQFRYPSAGSVFRNPPLLSAGRLIDEAGMKGFVHKGAMVSPYHANFIVNAGGATSRDIWELSQIVLAAVEKKFNITLEYEIRLLGKFE